MQRAVRFIQMFIRLSGVTLLILGLIIWSGTGDSLVAPHTALGMLFVVALWTLAALGGVAGIKPTTVIRAVIWGFVAVSFGMVQRRMMVGDLHWLIRALHLLIGLVTIGVGEMVAAATRQRLADATGGPSTDPLAGARRA
jgi:hypothetical protein